MCFARIINLFLSDEEWNKTLAARERQVRKELKRLRKAYDPKLKKVDGDEHKQIWIEYSTQCKDLEDELLSISGRRWAVEIPDHWDDSDMDGYFSQTQETRARNAMKRAIRGEEIKGLSVVVTILSLFVAILALLVGFFSVVVR